MRSDFVREAGLEPIFSSAISRRGRHLTEEGLETFRLVHETSIRGESVSRDRLHRLHEAGDFLCRRG